MLKPLVLASRNWKVLLKSILYQALLLALIVALGYLMFGSLIDDVANVLRENHVGDFLSDTVHSVMAGDFDNQSFSQQLADLLESVRNAISSVHMPFGGVAMSYVLFCVIFIVYRLLVSLTDVAVACQLEEFMTSNAERPFTWFFIKKQGITWKFVLLQTACALPIDILIVSGCVGFYLLFLVAFNWWTVIPVAILGVLFYVARLTFFSFTLPSVACKSGSVRMAFKQGLARAPLRFWHVFWKTLVVVAVMAGVSLLSMLYIDNAIAKTVVSIVPSFVLFFYIKCINMVEYFRFDNRPFFYKRVYVEGTDRYNRRQQRREKRAK